MARLYLIRHGEPSGTWSDSRDPGLTPLGLQQAQAAAEQLRAFGPLDVISSPLRRARETAEPFAALRGVSPKIVEAIAEIPTPAGVALDKRSEWLRGVMVGEWRAVEPALQEWRAGVIAFLQSLPRDTAIFSHYVAINVAVAAARRDDRVTVFAPTHASITILHATPLGLDEVELGHTGQTTVR
jgi:broad specificity phosphatase PhoE